MTWTRYDKTRPATWPPVAGTEVLVAYRALAGRLDVVVTWAAETALWIPADGGPPDVDAEWCDPYVDASTEVWWRPLGDTDYPPNVAR